MNCSFTEANKANGSAPTIAVKKPKRGDVREDGKVFWAERRKRQHLAKKEYWVSPELFKKLSEGLTAAAKSWRQNNPEKLRFVQKEWYSRNTKKVSDKNKKWAAANREKLRLRSRKWFSDNPEKRVIYSKNWRLSHPEYMPSYCKKRRASDPEYSLYVRTSNHLGKALRMADGAHKSKRTESILGCSFSSFKLHLENQFLPGMSFENRSAWHIDHIVPCSLAEGAEEIESMFHFSNLRPMWAQDNRLKSNKLPPESDLPANLSVKVREIWERSKPRP